MEIDFVDNDFRELCSLFEAVSYIAFGTTERKTSRFYKENEEKIEQAKSDLLLSIQIGNVKAYGTNKNGKPVKIDAYGDVELSIYDNVWCSTFVTADADEHYLTYVDVCVDFDDLKKDFGNKTTKDDKTDIRTKTGYTTPYIDIIFSVINSQNISQEYQGKVEHLKDVIKTEMRNRELPKSDNLAGAIATIIRLPESQKGKAKK